MKPLLPILPLFMLAACGSEETVSEASPPADQASVRADHRVECASSGTSAFARACTVEQVRDETGLVLVLRAPDGGFRRLRVTDDGRGVIAADGAEAAQVRPLNEDLIEVRIGRDRYRLPATVQPLGK